MTHFEEKLAHFRIPLADLKTATNDFAEENLLKRGEDSDVYKGKLQLVTGRDVVIRKFIRTQFQFHDFNEWIVRISGFKHKKFVCFTGFCEEEGERMIVMERVVNGSLWRHLSTLTCLQRLEACFDAAVALKDWRRVNDFASDWGIGFKILLDKDWKAKILVCFEPDTKNSPGYFLGKTLLEVLYGRKVANEDAVQAKSWHDIINIIDPYLKKEMLGVSLFLFRDVITICIEKPQDFIYRGVRLLEKAHEIQWKHKNSVKEQFMIPRSVIVTATNDFDEKYLIGSGGYGKVYKAELNLSHIASCYGKKLRSRCNSSTMLYTVAIKRIEVQNASQVLSAELDALHQCEDPNIVTLLAYYEDDKEMLLVYEYASNISLEYQLESTNKEISFRQWTQRLKICIDIAKGLEYLHTNTEAKRVIVHRDIKSANILLFENMKAKIADFGLSKVHVGQESTINTNRWAGTNYYIDPEYANTGRLKKASDIYSFGVVLFEIFSGKLVFDESYMMQNDMCLVPIARTHFINGTLKEILDAELMDEAPELGLTLKVRPDHDSLDVFSNIAYQCLSRSQDKRPTIQAVIQDLKKALQLQENRMRTFKFSLEHIKWSTNNFSDDKCILKGGHEMLYEGTIQDPNGHINVLLKRFTNQEHGFLKEFEVLFKYRHENIIGLVGYSKEMDESIIVYEHASKGCLNRYLKDTSFSWIQRLKVCIDIARGLKFLHEGDVGQDVVIHRDIKSSNILLTMDSKAKIYGFKDDPNDVVGSAGYLDPSYYHTNDLTKESDIYSFGVVLFEILCGRMAFPEENSDNKEMLDCLVKSRNREARVEEIVFEELKKHIVLKSLTIFRRIAFKCLHENCEERPRAGDVLVELHKALKIQICRRIMKKERLK